MIQIGIPALASVVNTGWSPPPVYAQIDAVNSPPPDDSYVACTLPPGGTFEVQIAPLARPITGTHTLRVRLDQVGSNVALVSFFLLQGGQVIAGRSVVPGTTFTTYELTLTEVEVDLITDYTNLRLRVVAILPGSASGSGSGPGSGLGSGSGSRPGSVPPGSAPGVGSGSVRSGSGPSVGPRSGVKPSGPPTRGSKSGSGSGISGSRPSGSGSMSGIPGSTSGLSGSLSGVSGSGSGQSGSGPSGGV